MSKDGFRSKEMQWLASHTEEIDALPDGEWLAVDGDEFIAHAPSLRELMELSAAKGHPDPLITAVMPEGTNIYCYGSVSLHG